MTSVCSTGRAIRLINRYIGGKPDPLIVALRKHSRSVAANAKNAAYCAEIAEAASGDAGERIGLSEMLADAVTNGLDDMFVYELAMKTGFRATDAAVAAALRTPGFAEATAAYITGDNCLDVLSALSCDRPGPREIRKIRDAVNGLSDAEWKELMRFGLRDYQTMGELVTFRLVRDALGSEVALREIALVASPEILSRAEKIAKVA